jgi:hypothetical protein
MILRVISLGKCLKYLSFAGLLAAAISRPAAAVECWQGWGYWVDAQTRAYKSQEMLLVTDGPAGWVAGNPVTLRVLDRATGRIDETTAPIVALPLESRVYYRGSANYVDGLADVDGAADRIVFGLSQIAPSVPTLPAMEAYTAWACGLGRKQG